MTKRKFYTSFHIRDENWIKLKFYNNFQYTYNMPGTTNVV